VLVGICVNYQDAFGSIYDQVIKIMKSYTKYYIK